MRRFLGATIIAGAALCGACEGLVDFGARPRAQPEPFPDAAPRTASDAGVPGASSDAAPPGDAARSTDGAGVADGADVPDGADASADAGVPDGADASADADAADGALPCPLDRPDFYVPSPPPCGFPTITAALAAARQSSAKVRTVHVAPGTYTRARGETFPLDLRGGISLVGTGAAPADTIIEGLGALDHAIEGGEVTSASVTLVTGAPDVASSIANLRILSGDDDATASQGLGIFCDRGNAAATLAQPDPTLTVDHVIVDHGYATGISVSNSAYPRSGCNARVTATAFYGAWAAFSWRAVTAGGCDATPSPAPSSVQLGDGTAAHANTFQDIGKGDGTAGAVTLGQCTAQAIIATNTFNAGEVGVDVEAGGANDHVSITGNTFTGQANGGVRLAARAIVEEISGNTFTGCEPAAVWALSGSSQILRARTNRFLGNMKGVSIEGDAVIGTFDFGTAASQGDNEFRCNASTRTNDTGYDLGQAKPAASGGLLTAFGNAWDHAPPTASATPANGQDVMLPGSGANPELGGATVSASACPSGRAPGP